MLGLMEAEAISERTTVGVFARQAERLADRVILRHHQDGGWRELKWSDLRDLVIRVGARLVEEGVGAGDRVILMSENRVEWLYCDLAIQASGGVTVPVYPSTPPKTAQHIAENSEAVLAIASDAEMAGKLQARGALRKVVTMDDDVKAWAEDEPRAEAVKELDARSAGLRPDDLASLCYTSGTTGEPKGVMLAHRNFVDAAHSCLGAFDLGPDDISLSFLPFSHVLERINGIFVGMVAGGSTYLSRGVDRLAEDIAEVRPTVMVSVPRVYEKMHGLVQQRVAGQPPWIRLLFHWSVGVGRKHSRTGGARLRFKLADRLVLRPLRERLTGGRLRFFVSGGAPLAREVEEFFWASGVKILQGWGMTETSSGATSNTETAHKFETVGRALPGVELKIVEDGEILVKSPGNMLGYFRNEAATREVLEDGWVRTGDIGELDEDGFLKITDRKKDLIKTAGGKYVAPQPLEAKLQEDAAIERVVVIGDERPYVTALVVPDWERLKRQAGLSGDPEKLVTDPRAVAVVQKRVDALNSELGSWESIKYFTLLPADFTEESGEITPTLKVKRRAIQEHYKETIDRMYQREKPQGGRGSH